MGGWQQAEGQAGKQTDIQKQERKRINMCIQVCHSLSHISPVFGALLMKVYLSSEVIHHSNYGNRLPDSQNSVNRILSTYLLWTELQEQVKKHGMFTVTM